MQIIFLTAFLTSVLVFFFVLLFIHDQKNKKRTASPEQAALLPLQDDVSDSNTSISSSK